MKYTLLFLTLVLFSGCDSVVSSEEVSLDEEFTLRIGQQKVLEHEKISIQFNEVAEDSRCPEGVQCVWAGNAKVMLSFGQSDIILNTYSEPKARRVGDFQVRLVKLDPYPVYPEEIEGDEYVARILITKTD